MTATWIDDLVRPGRRLVDAGDGLLSALDPGERDAPYDRHAALYDRVVGNGLYNRLLWGASTASYAAFAATAVAAARGPLLDVGCGSVVFTAAGYRTAGRPLVLVDRSLGMLARAAQRLGGHHPARWSSSKLTCSTCRSSQASSPPWHVTGCCTCSTTSPPCSAR